MNKTEPIFYLKGNHLYFIFQDKYFNESNNTIEKYLNNRNYNNLNSSNKKTIITNILNIFNQNTFLKYNTQRYKNYISNLNVCITNITIENSPIYIHLYIIPKEINFEDEDNFILDIEDKITFIEKFVFNIFDEYCKNIEPKKIKLSLNNKLKENVNTFLQYELYFYLEQLKELENLIFTHNWNYKYKNGCYDKLIGIPNDFLNLKTGNNPLKIYQKIKVKEQSKLGNFIYSTIKFLKEKRIDIFKNESGYNKITEKIKDIENFIFDITENDIEVDEIINANITDNNIIKNELLNYFNTYEEHEEIQNNYEIFTHIKLIFMNVLSNGFYIFETIDLSRFLEKATSEYLLTKLQSNEKLFVGDENQKSIYDIKNINNKYKLLNESCLIEVNKEFKQFPDNLVIIENDKEQHIIKRIYDAKYYLYNDLISDENKFLKIREQKRLFEYLNQLQNKDDDTNKITEIAFIIPDNIDLKYSKEYKKLTYKFHIKSDEKDIKVFFDGINVNIIKLKLFKD